jgi:hypothetical protein
VTGLIAELQVHAQTRNERTLPICETIDSNPSEMQTAEEAIGFRVWNENEPGILLSARKAADPVDLSAKTK